MTPHITWIAALGIMALGTRLAAEGENVSTGIIGPIADGTPAPPVEPPPKPDFVVRSTVERSMLVEEAPEITGLPSVKGRISVTLNRVDDPKLPNPPSPAPSAASNDPAVQERIAELRENHEATVFGFVSASVYDRSRTLVEWHPNGQPGERISAWSNIDFNHFTGFASYKVRDADGEVTNYSLLLTVNNLDTSLLEQAAAKKGRLYDPPVIPDLPPITEGPAFVLTEGDTSNLETMRIIEGMHELYRVEGERMEQAYEDRTRALEERRAFLLANPPQPKDVTIHFWKREQPTSGEIQTQGGTGE